MILKFWTAKVGENSLNEARILDFLLFTNLSTKPFFKDKLHGLSTLTHTASLFLRPMAKSVSETPLMQQHKAIKAKYPDAVLLFRVGDFYETFGEDAIITSQVLGITLTKRNNGSASSSELAGFPHHALDTYLHKLVKAGYRVAICDQLEDPKQAKGIVKRGVTELLTPGTTTNDKLLENESNNFLAAVHFVEDNLGLAFLDISTGEFFITEGNKEYADKLLQSLRPAEVIFQRNKQKLFKEWFGHRFYTYHLEEWIFADTYANEMLLKQFQTHSLKGFGIESMKLGIIAAGAVLHYLKDTEHPNLGHITGIHRLTETDYLWMDRFTIRNLELLGSANDGGHSLIKVMDSTVSAMGARLMRRWMVLPLKDKQRIEERLDTVEALLLNTDLRKQLQHLIKQSGDVERLVAKLPLKKINPREVLHLAKSLQYAEEIKKHTATSNSNYLKRLSDTINPCKFIADKIIDELTEQPPVAVSKGMVIKDGVNKELDDLRRIAHHGKEYLLEIQQRESEATGIPSLKISFNNVFGYYLEVTNVHKNKVPAEWTRKQTLANAERYITPELKEYEEKITGAEEKIQVIESALFEQLLNELQEYISPIQTNAQVMAIIDCVGSFAENALQYKYIKPQLTGLIVLMAHMGSFVPASEAHIPITDKIFTRVGASDNLSGGESTFMVEMNETASIINNLSDKSLILLDEIGRGTSTYDGISIAWSIAEFLHQSSHQPKTLFATHYHELNELEEKFSRIKNYHITNKEVGNKVVFLRKLAPGGSVHSFGIHVARMAGMPPALINRANEVLKQLEDQRSQADIKHQLKQLPVEKMQLSIFDVHSQTFDEIRTMLEGMDINRLTPVEALLKLQEIKGKLK